jgi:hypothetical protein
MLDGQVRDVAVYLADMDHVNPEDWEQTFVKYQKLVASGECDGYAGIFDSGYERAAVMFALFHEFEDRFVAQCDYMDGVDHPNVDEVFVFELYRSIYRGALMRVLDSDVDIDAWNFLGRGV